MTAIGDTHAVLRDLLRVKCVFQLRTIEAVLNGPAIAMARGSAETLAAPVPQDCQARAVGIAQHDRDFIRKCREQDKLNGIEWEGTKE
jgi:hypothetical protein